MRFTNKKKCLDSQVTGIYTLQDVPRPAWHDCDRSLVMNLPPPTPVARARAVTTCSHVPAGVQTTHLLLPSDDEHGHDGDDGAVHGHRDGHLVQRDAVEQRLHVLHRVYGHTGHAHVARHARVVRVVTRNTDTHSDQW